MIKCKICGLECKANNGLSWHIKKAHNLSFKEYLDKHGNIPNCPICNIDKCKTKGTTIRKTCGDESCIKIISSRKHTESSKAKIRKARIEYLKKRTGKTAWERRAEGKMSYLEQWFFDEVITKYELPNEYDIISEHSVYPYFIDFAFINIHLAVELDGACHFNNGTERVEHDIKRDKILSEKGWNIFRIKYNETNQAIITEFLNYLKTIKVNPKILTNRVYKNREANPQKKHKKREVKPHRSQQEYYDEVRSKNYEKEKHKINVVLNSGIDFTKIGWVKQLSVIIDKRPQKVNGWMKKYMPEFYETKCFKRSKN